MEVFGLKSQSLKYSMGGFGSVQLYLTPQELGIIPRRHAMAAPNSSSKAVLVVGASRGIGFQLVDQLAQQPHHHIIASVRSDAGPDNPRVQTIQLDQSSPNSVKAAAVQVKELDTIIVNAAIGSDEKLLSTSDERMAEYMDVNVTGVLRVVKAFLPALRARKTRQIVLVSSIAGSLTRQVNAKGGGFAGTYAVSKAALNMVAVQLHNELHAAENFTVIPIHPGWVDTDMGRIAGDGGMPPEKSAAGIIGVLQKLKLNDSATFFSYDGTTLPW